MISAIELTQRLVRADTVNPPGNEGCAATLIAPLLEDAGFQVEILELAPRRASVVARLPPKGGGADGDRAPICFTGHLDVVPFGHGAWSCDPLGGDLDGTRLYGRGSSDMKSGVAAIVCAAREMARFPHRRAGVLLILTAGEETGCDGARALIEGGLLGQPRAGAIVVGEPTLLRPVTAHKGAMWVKLICRGKLAHAAMPELGENAILKAMAVIERLQRVDLGRSSALQGSPTMNVGVIRGGTVANQVPDRCETLVDVRTVEGPDPRALFQRMLAACGEDTEVERLLDIPPLFTDEADEWIQRTFALAQRFVGITPKTSSVNYFTDAALLKPFLGGAPTLICGPGDPAEAHQTDEHVDTRLIENAVEYYVELARDYCANP